VTLTNTLTRYLKTPNWSSLSQGLNTGRIRARPPRYSTLGRSSSSPGRRTPPRSTARGRHCRRLRARATKPHSYPDPLSLSLSLCSSPSGALSIRPSDEERCWGRGAVRKRDWTTAAREEKAVFGPEGRPSCCTVVSGERPFSRPVDDSLGEDLLRAASTRLTFRRSRVRERLWMSPPAFPRALARWKSTSRGRTRLASNTLFLGRQ